MLSTLICAGLLGTQVPDYICCPADVALLELGRRFDEKWVVAGDVARNVVVVRPGEDDAEEIRTGVAKVLNAEWVKQGDQWTLLRTDKKRAELEAADRDGMRAAIEKERRRWQKEASERRGGTEQWFSRVEGVLARVSRGDTEAINQAYTETSEGGFLNEHLLNVLLSLPVNELAMAGVDHPITFSTKPKAGQLKIPDGVVKEFAKYQVEFVKAREVSLAKLPAQQVDPRMRMDAKSGVVDRVIAHATESYHGVLSVIIMFIDSDGWIIASASRTVMPRSDPADLRALKGVEVEMPVLAKDLSGIWEKFMTGARLNPSENRLLDVGEVDPSNWIQGCYLDAMATAKSKSLYAAVPDFLGMMGIMRLKEDIRDAATVFAAIFDTQTVQLVEHDSHWYVLPVRPLANEKSFLNRDVYAKFVKEYREDGYLRPHTIGRYAVGQDSTVSMDSWDRMFLMPSTAASSEVFFRFYRLSYLVLGTGVNQIGTHPPGRVDLRGTSFSPMVWKLVQRELNIPITLRLAYPESVTPEDRKNISGQILTESFANGLPRDFRFWADVQAEETLTGHFESEGWTYQMSWVMRDWIMDNFDKVNGIYATHRTEVLTYGVADSKGVGTELIFPSPVDSKKFLPYDQLPAVWRDWMSKQSELYRKKYPETVAVPPPP